MKTITLYHKASGAIVGRVSAADGTDMSEYATAEIGVLNGSYDADTTYVFSGLPTPREDASTFPPLTVTVGSVAVFSGLPSPCWVMVDSNVIALTGGSFSFTPNKVKTYTATLIGRWRGTLTVVSESAESTALTADSRWQALKTATPQQIENWVDNNVTNLAQARDLFKTLLKMVKVLYERTL